MIRVNKIVLKRAYFESGVKTNLNIFSDASMVAMCTVAYLRKQGINEVTFVIRKCIVAQIRNNTVTKIVTAVFGVGLRDFILEEHDTELDRNVHWTDPTTVLQWLHASNNKQPVFVANSVAEIVENSTSDLVAAC